MLKASMPRSFLETIEKDLKAGKTDSTLELLAETLADSDLWSEKDQLKCGFCGKDMTATCPKCYRAMWSKG